MFLKAGYMEDWKFYGTYRGCPQGGIISPILANIYLNELDKKLTALMLKTPAKLCNDKKLNYVRYADDFLIAVNGDWQDCEWVKVKLTEFIRDSLKMEVSPEKTLITHSSECARFLSYDVRVRRAQQVKPWKKCKQRTMNHTVELLIPLQNKIEKFLFARSAVRQRGDNGKLEPVAWLKAKKCEL